MNKKELLKETIIQLKNYIAIIEFKCKQRDDVFKTYANIKIANLNNTIKQLEVMKNEKF